MKGTMGHARLLAPKPEEELETGLDVLLRRAREREQGRRDVIPDPEMGVRGGTERQPWSAEDVGRLVLNAIAGVSPAVTASVLGREPQSVITKLLWIRRKLKPMTPPQRGARGGNGKAKK